MKRSLLAIILIKYGFSSGKVYKIEESTENAVQV